MKRSHNAVWLRIQRFSQLTEHFQVGRVDRVAVDESWFQIGGEEAWLWIAVEPYRRRLPVRVTSSDAGLALLAPAMRGVGKVLCGVHFRAA
jgi:transposase-like protein